MEHLIKIVERLATNVSTLVLIYANDLEHRSSCGRPATNHDLQEMEQRIMKAITDFAAAQAAFNTRQGAAVDAAVASVTALTGDVQTLNDKITELQDSNGGITPEDQALLDDLQAQGEALAAKGEALAAALATLDALTPPVVPPVA